MTFPQPLKAAEICCCVAVNGMFFTNAVLAQSSATNRGARAVFALRELPGAASPCCLAVNGMFLTDAPLAQPPPEWAPLQMRPAPDSLLVCNFKCLRVRRRP